MRQHRNSTRFAGTLLLRHARRLLFYWAAQRCNRWKHRLLCTLNPHDRCYPQGAARALESVSYRTVVRMQSPEDMQYVLMVREGRATNLV